MKLGDSGIGEVSRTNPTRSVVTSAAKGNPEKGPVVSPPCVWFKFDEAQGDVTKEAVSGVELPVAGHKTLWKQGVSARRCNSTGYHSLVALPAAKAPVIRGDLTLEGWFALGAYPWNWAPLVQQGDNDGYFLGVDSHGYPGFMAKIGGVWQQLSVPSRPPYADENHLTLFHWYHIAGTYDKAEGAMRLYTTEGDRRENRRQRRRESVNADIRVGKAGILRMPTEALHDTLPSEFGLDGLIDEVRIYKAALRRRQVAESYKSFHPAPAIAALPDMQRAGVSLSRHRGYPSSEIQGRLTRTCPLTRPGKICGGLASIPTSSSVSADCP